MRNESWEPVKDLQMAAFAAGMAALALLQYFSPPGFILGLDHANLLFHEAGHPITGLFSQRLEPYGGTFGQIFFPLLLMVSFWRKGRAVEVAAATVWFFENWLNIAHYMADARKLELPLVGGGDHDWNTIFARWDVLQHEIAISGVVKTTGWIGIGAACAWILWRWWRDRTKTMMP
jgi:hypothetical protein